MKFLAVFEGRRERKQFASSLKFEQWFGDNGQRHDDANLKRGSLSN
jgi:hypothetical protein